MLPRFPKEKRFLEKPDPSALEDEKRGKSKAGGKPGQLTFPKLTKGIRTHLRDLTQEVLTAALMPLAGVCNDSSPTRCSGLPKLPI